MTNNISNLLMSICNPEGSITVTNQRFGSHSSLPEVVELSDNQQKEIEKVLINHLDLDKVVWIDLPILTNKASLKVLSTQTRKLSDSDNPHKGGTCYLYEIQFTPIIYDPSSILEPIKEGCSITPTFYSPLDFTPYKKIVIEYSSCHSGDINSDEDMKQYLRDKLEKILENPQDYQNIGFRGVMIRSIIVSEPNKA